MLRASAFAAGAGVRRLPSLVGGAHASYASVLLRCRLASLTTRRAASSATRGDDSSTRTSPSLSRSTSPVRVIQTNSDRRSVFRLENTQHGDRWVIEHDEASPSSSSSLPRDTSLRSTAIAQRVRSFFMPARYPHSVSSDYWACQKHLVSQSVVSSMMQVLATHCLLTAVGIGATSSFALSATINWVLKDGLGGLGLMFVANKFGSLLDVYPKRAKFLSDILLLVGVALEMSTPLVPSVFLLLASVATTAKAVAGLVGGSTKAAIYREFAITHNLGDVCAKGYSQGVAAYTVGMGGGIVVSLLCEQLAHPLWGMFAAFSVLASANVWFGFHAMSQVRHTSLNPDRAQIVLDRAVPQIPCLSLSTIPTPEQVRQLEPFVRWSRVRHLSMVMGAGITDLAPTPARLQTLAELYHDLPYVISISRRPIRPFYRLHQQDRNMAFIGLSPHATAADRTRAMLHALLVARELSHGYSEQQAVRDTRQVLDHHFDSLLQGLRDQGWHTDFIHCLSQDHTLELLD